MGEEIILGYRSQLPFPILGLIAMSGVMGFTPDAPARAEFKRQGRKEQLRQWRQENRRFQGRTRGRGR